VERVSGLASTIRVLFWIAAVASVLVALAAVNRKSSWTGFLEGDKNLSDLDAADGLLGGSILIVLVVTLAAAIVLCIWTIKATRNGNNLWQAGASPGLAGASWFIPIAWFFLPYMQLKKVIDRSGIPAGLLIGWWVSFAGGQVLNFIGRSAAQLDVDDPGGVSGQLDRQIVWFGVAAVVTIVSAYFGGKTVVSLSRAEEDAVKTPVY
jgi:hypothetical protein